MFGPADWVSVVELTQQSRVADLITERERFPWAVKRVNLSAVEFAEWGVPYNYAEQLAGESTFLKKCGFEDGFGDVHWMTDAAHEVIQQAVFDSRMYGSVLIGGLGLGVITRRACMKQEVDRVKVVELDEDVIRLVGEPLMQAFPGKLQIDCADVHEWIPDRHYDCAWFDIWPDVHPRYLNEMADLYQAYSPSCNMVDFWMLTELGSLLEECRTSGDVELTLKTWDMVGMTFKQVWEGLDLCHERGKKLLHNFMAKGLRFEEQAHD